MLTVSSLKEMRSEGCVVKFKDMDRLEVGPQTPCEIALCANATQQPCMLTVALWSGKDFEISPD